MKNIAYIGYDYFAARNLFLEMKRAAIGWAKFRFFHRGNLALLTGAQFDVIYCNAVLTPEQTTPAKSCLVATTGVWMEGKPSLANLKG